MSRGVDETFWVLEEAERKRQMRSAYGIASRGCTLTPAFRQPSTAADRRCGQA